MKESLSRKKADRRALGSEDSQHQPRPHSAKPKSQQKPPHSAIKENQAMRLYREEARTLEEQMESGTITPTEQNRLNFVQAKIADAHRNIPAHAVPPNPSQHELAIGSLEDELGHVGQRADDAIAKDKSNYIQISKRIANI
jgi:hypothetical protein